VDGAGVWRSGWARKRLLHARLEFHAAVARHGRCASAPVPISISVAVYVSVSVSISVSVSVCLSVSCDVCICDVCIFAEGRKGEREEGREGGPIPRVLSSPDDTVHLVLYTTGTFQISSSSVERAASKLQT
jgi:hypothetical protein